MLSISKLFERRLARVDGVGVQDHEADTDAANEAVSRPLIKLLNCARWEVKCDLLPNGRNR
jgi:hypothetical protein